MRLFLLLTKQKGGYTMNARQLHALRLRETDTDGAIRRMCDSETIYTACLRAFLEDPSVRQLNQSVAGALWDDAFTAAHALKGVAGNMGFIPLMHNTGQLIVLIRRGQLHDIQASMEQVNSAYRDIIDGIRQYFAYADENEEGDAI